MKKSIFLLINLIFLFIINNSLGVTENDVNNPTIERIKKEIYIKYLTKQIEFESEIVIPDYVDAKYVEYIYNLASELELPTRMVFRLIYKESCFVDTVSSEGADGFMQIMPKTHEIYVKKLNVDSLNLDNNQKNIYIGMHMLKDLYDFWIERGNSDEYSWKLSLASYNAGIGKVLYYDGIPPYKETIKYIRFILMPSTNVKLNENKN